MAMQHIFSRRGEARLAMTLSRLPLLAFDFDGTLAPIVARPERARVKPGVASRLKALAERLPVAIVTGREVADVRPRLGFEPKYVIGSHGAESDLGIDDASWMQDLQQARDWLLPHRSELQELGIRLEDKGNSIALHYRLAPDRQLAVRRLEEILGAAGPALHVFGGKLVYNIVAARAPDKADAVHALVRHAQCAAAVFVGDDVNDEPVFERAPGDWLTIRVGRSDLQSKAQFCLDSPEEMARLLDAMLMLLGAPAG